MLYTLLAKALLVSLGFLVVSLIRIVVYHVSVYLHLRRIPGPRRSSLLWGEEWKLYSSFPGSMYVDWHERYGKVVRFNGAFGHQVISIIDPRAISFILNEATYKFPKPDGVRAWFKATLGEGILWVEGKQAHGVQRRSLAPALSQLAVRDLVPVFLETSMKLTSQWIKLIDNNHNEQAEIEVTMWAGRFALDTIGRAAFSYDFDSLSGESHTLAESLDSLTNCEHKISSFYMRAIFWLCPWILAIGDKGKLIKKTKHELGQISSNMWRDAKLSGDSEGKTLMALMLKANSDSQCYEDEEHIVSQMRTVISAGYETVSAVVAWTLYELSQDLKLQGELRKEVFIVGELTLDALNNHCPLLNAVLKETLRLHPALLENHHEAAETIRIPLSEPLPGTTDMDIIIPRGTLLAIPVSVVQTACETWGPDSLIFRPGRWLEEIKEGEKRRDLLAFSEGPRSCIGRSFAMAEIKTLIITILRQFSFTCSHDIEAFQSFVIRPRVKGQNMSSLPLTIHKL